MTRKLRLPVRSYEQALDIYHAVSSARRGARHTLATHPSKSIRRYKMADACLYRKVRGWDWDTNDEAIRVTRFAGRAQWPGIYVSQLPAELNITSVDNAYVREGLIPRNRIAFSYTFGGVRRMRDVVVWRPDGSCVIARNSGAPYESGLRNVVNNFSPVVVYRERGGSFFSFQNDCGKPNYKRRYIFPCLRTSFYQENISVVLPVDKRRKPYDLVDGIQLITREEQITANKHARARAARVEKLVRTAMQDETLNGYLHQQLRSAVAAQVLAGATPTESPARISNGGWVGLPQGVNVEHQNTRATAGAVSSKRRRAIIFEE